MERVPRSEAENERPNLEATLTAALEWSNYDLWLSRMSHTILVALDGSRRAEAVLGPASEFAVGCGGTLVLLRTVEPVPPSGSEELYLPERLTHRAREERLNQAESYLAVLRENLSRTGMPIRTRVAYGDAVDAIARTAEREGATFIAIACERPTGLTTMLCRDVVTRLLHRVDQSLIVVKPG